MSKTIATQCINDSIKQCFLLASVSLISGIALFLVLEPTVGRSAPAFTNSEFTIRQEIVGEISFLVQPADVSMSGALNGITGGNATGTTFAVVQTNNSAGYVMDIAFSNSPAMRGEATTSTSSLAIRDYDDTGEPEFNFSASTSALFAYTVNASTTTDLDPSFLDNGSACNTGTGNIAERCWKGASTTNFRIIDRDTAANTGATTSIQFVVNVPNNPIPSVEADFYTATATLTATNQ